MQIRPLLSRILGPYIGMVTAWLGADALDLAAPLVEDLETALLTASVLVVYGVTHKVLDGLGINPLDDAGGGGGGT